MNNKLLAIALGGLVGAHAFAIDLDSPASTPVLFAAETVAPSGGANTTISETISNTLGFGITEHSERYLRYDLAGTRFLDLPTLAITGQSGSGIVYVGGGIDKDFVIFEVISDTGTSISPTDTATLSFGAGSPNLALDGVTVTAVYSQYFTAPGALNQNPLDLLATSSGALFAFQRGTEIASTTTGTDPLAIDFASSNTRFADNETRSAIGSFYAAEVPGDQFLLDGTTDITIAVSRTAASQLRVLGDFSATANPTTGQFVPERVFLSNDGCTSSALNAQTVTADEAVLVLGNSSLGTIDPNPELSSGPDICIEVNGESVIPETDFTARYEPVAASGFSLPETTIVLGSLRKNSATDTQNLVLTPTGVGGTYPNFIRVTNTSAAAGGDVFLRLINDAGESGPSLMLEDVTGGSSSRLEAGASTRNIDVDEVYAASIAADPSWDIGSGRFNKLRLVTSGDFESIAVTLISISLDETTFSTF